LVRLSEDKSVSIVGTTGGIAFSNITVGCVFSEQVKRREVAGKAVIIKSRYTPGYHARSLQVRSILGGAEG